MVNPVYCSEPPGGDQDYLASLLGTVMLSIFIYSLLLELWSFISLDSVDMVTAKLEKSNKLWKGKNL